MPPPVPLSASVPAVLEAEKSVMSAMELPPLTVLKSAASQGAPPDPASQLDLPGTSSSSQQLPSTRPGFGYTGPTMKSSTVTPGIRLASSADSPVTAPRPTAPSTVTRRSPGHSPVQGTRERPYALSSRLSQGRSYALSSRLSQGLPRLQGGRHQEGQEELAGGEGEVPEAGAGHVRQL